MFERRLEGALPHIKDITYDINDLYNYIDACRLQCSRVLSRHQRVPAFNRSGSRSHYLKRQAGLK